MGFLHNHVKKIIKHLEGNKPQETKRELIEESKRVRRLRILAETDLFKTQILTLMDDLDRSYQNIESGRYDVALSYARQAETRISSAKRILRLLLRDEIKLE